jgi:uncharacterized membrane protein YidH (DUF202 family)
MTESARKQAVWKAETKFCLANERTLIAWLRIATTLGVGSFLGLSVGKGRFKGQGVVYGVSQLMVAALIVLYAFAQFHRRAWLVRSRHMQTFDEWIGPGVVSFTVAFALAFEITKLVREPAVGCPLLPLPLHHGLVPPFIYITFHGSSNLRHGCDKGVAGVHRFGLGGEYGGSVVDPFMSGQVYSPRGMARLSGLLFVAESAMSDPRCAKATPNRGHASRLTTT